MRKRIKEHRGRFFRIEDRPHVPKELHAIQGTLLDTKELSPREGKDGTEYGDYYILESN